MIARVAEHEDIPAEADEQYVARFRELLAVLEPQPEAGS